ncbi:MAG: hypothetical protein WC903_03895 [Candidatus Margulisiibacteriota bacterium]
MKLDDKIQTRRVAYLLKGEQSTAFELALLYYILATRRSAEDKIVDACLKSIQWLKKAEIGISDNISNLEPSDQLKSLEKVLVNNKTMICRKADLPDRQALVHAIPMFYRDFGLAY